MIRGGVVTLISCFAVAAHALEVTGPMIPGGLVRGVAAPGTTITVDGKSIPIAPDGAFIYGIGRDATGTVVLLATSRDGFVERRELTLDPRTYEVQRIDGLPQDKVTPDSAILARIKAETARIRAARVTTSALSGWRDRFIWPAQGPISGVYGSQRILNGVPRAPHLGLDIAAGDGAPVVAPAPGRVILAGRDYVLTGNTLMIDHGLGLFSIFAHLSRIEIEEGALVTAGARLGAVGKTGRATGPHLHWGLYWFDTAVDPALVLPQAEAFGIGAPAATGGE